MKVYSEITLLQFTAWSGGIDTQKRIIEEGKSKDFDSLIEELWPDGISAGKLNDLLWFDSEWVYKSLRMAERNEEGDELVVGCAKCGHDVYETNDHGHCKKCAH